LKKLLAKKEKGGKVFTCKHRFRYSRERASQSLQKLLNPSIPKAKGT